MKILLVFQLGIYLIVITSCTTQCYSRTESLSLFFYFPSDTTYWRNIVLCRVNKEFLHLFYLPDFYTIYLYLVL